MKTIAQAERLLAFLYQDWFKVNLQGLQYLPKEGPVLLVGNAGGVFPWAAFMLMYALMSDKQAPRRLHILANLDGIEDERLYNFLREIGFVSYSADNARKLFADGETVVIFPEGACGALKPYSERYRLRSLDWTQLMPAIEARVPILPLATIGPDESFPMVANLQPIAKLLSLPAFPITATFPWLPFPANFLALPIKWKMRVLKAVDYGSPLSRDEVEEAAKKQALFIEGDIQAELNRLLRMRIRPLF